MARDLKIEIFAHKFFHRLWYTMGEIEVVPDILEIYGDECVVDDSYLEACDDLLIKAACCRSSFIVKKYMSSVSFEEMANFKTLSELYDYIIRMCDRDDLFGHLTVFERLLATSDFVARICYRYQKETDSPIDVIMYGYILWSMYFDKFTEEFYEKGGWSQLKREAKCYKLFSEFDTIFCGFSVFCLPAIKEATVNFSYFKNAVSYQEQKHQHPVHISVLWIKFRIEHFESYINIPLSYQTSVSAYEADLLLDDLKLILDPTRCKPDVPEISKHQSSTFSSEMSYSEIPSTFGDRKVNQGDETQTTKITSKDLPTLKDTSSINKNSNNDDEIRRVKIARKEVRNEQSDHKVKNFLRMLLVLGDIEGTEFVLSTLQNIEESLETAQESSNKQKKKPKTKETEFERSTLKNNQDYPEKSRESLNVQKKRSKKKRPKK